jgi:general L-amino acid transport system permease protein
VLLGAVVAVLWLLGSEAVANLARRNTAFGFGYLADHANFDIPFRLISWEVGDTYARALAVCVLNTLLVSALSIVTATLLGGLIGVMRLSANWLVRNIALVYIETIRNTPILVQIFFFYIATLQTLPGPRQSIHLPGGMLFNIRGLYLPIAEANGAASILWPLALVAAIGVPVLWRLPVRGGRLGLRSLLLVPIAVFAFSAGVGELKTPELRGFNIAGGVQVVPELLALWAGLTVYAAGFIAEIVRGALLAVPSEQRAAALSLGLRPFQILWMVVLPQALRIMVPPMTSQYLNIIKSSSLGEAIAYPELFQIFAGTVLQQTGREIESMMLLMAVFLSINLATSAFMNWYNRRVALVGG